MDKFNSTNITQNIPTPTIGYLCYIIQEQSIFSRSFVRCNFFPQTLTNKDELAASARAAPLPTTPTQIPHAKLERPVVNPAPNIAYPVQNYTGLLLHHHKSL